MTGVAPSKPAHIVMTFKNGNQGILKLLVLAGTNPKTLNFKKAYGLNFRLLSDQEGKTMQAFGVPTSQGGVIQKFSREKDLL